MCEAVGRSIDQDQLLDKWTHGSLLLELVGGYKRFWWSKPPDTWNLVIGRILRMGDVHSRRLVPLRTGCIRHFEMVERCVRVRVLVFYLMSNKV